MFRFLVTKWTALVAIMLAALAFVYMWMFAWPIRLKLEGTFTCKGHNAISVGYFDYFSGVSSIDCPEGKFEHIQASSVEHLYFSNQRVESIWVSRAAQYFGAGQPEVFGLKFSGILSDTVFVYSLEGSRLGL